MIFRVKGVCVSKPSNKDLENVKEENPENNQEVNIEIDNETREDNPTDFNNIREHYRILSCCCRRKVDDLIVDDKKDAGEKIELLSIPEDEVKGHKDHKS